MKKKILTTLSVLVAVALLAGGWFKFRLNRMYEKFNSELMIAVKNALTPQ